MRQRPRDARGRVGAVNAMFTGASSELGEFESGLSAAWWGLEPAVVLGVAGRWSRILPSLRRLDGFEAR